MKHYRLLKDLPDLSAGAEFIYDPSCPLNQLQYTDEVISYYFDYDDVDLDEWFEEVEEENEDEENEEDNDKLASPALVYFKGFWRLSDRLFFDKESASYFSGLAKIIWPAKDIDGNEIWYDVSE